MTRAEQQKLNKELVKAALKDDVGRIERLLAEGAQVDEPARVWRYGTLTALEATAIEAQEDAAKVLLAHGADINRQNENGDTPLMIALANRWVGFPDMLMDMGARIDILNNAGQSALDVSVAAENARGSEKVRARLRRQEMTKPQPAAPSSETPAPAPEPVVTPPPASVPEPATKKDPDIVIFSQQAGDRVLQDIFNFVTHERITLVRKDVDGPVEAMTRQGFSEIESRDFLRKAFDEHVRRGGKTAELDIFPDVKPKITQIPGANA